MRPDVAPEQRLGGRAVEKIRRICACSREERRESRWAPRARRRSRHRGCSGACRTAGRPTARCRPRAAPRGGPRRRSPDRSRGARRGSAELVLRMRVVALLAQRGLARHRAEDQDPRARARDRREAVDLQRELRCRGRSRSPAPDRHGAQQRREGLVIGIGQIGVALGRAGESQEKAVGEALRLAFGAAVGAPLERLDRADLELQRGEGALDLGDGGACVSGLKRISTTCRSMARAPRSLISWRRSSSRGGSPWC